jgi:hypothetical protein
MLAERHLELLTAFVDGELTLRQRNAVLRLLNQSSEARSILQELQQAAHRLRELPRRTLGASFAGQVLQAIADRGLQPAPQQPALRRRKLHWIGYGAAAALLIAVGIGVYLASHGQRAADTARVAARTEIKPSPVVVPPLQVTFKELALQPAREKLARKLQNETAVHLKLTVRDSASAVEHLQDALKGQGIKVIVDPGAHASLQQEGKAAIEYLVYAENIRPEELQAILSQLGEEPKNLAIRKRTFESMIVASLSGEDRQKLSGLFGVNASELEGPSGSGDAALFENKIIEAPKDKTKTAPPTIASQPERCALVIASHPGTGGASPEVRRFLASRPRQRPGTVQVLLVIRLT